MHHNHDLTTPKARLFVGKILSSTPPKKYSIALPLSITILIIMTSLLLRMPRHLVFVQTLLRLQLLQLSAKIGAN